MDSESFAQLRYVNTEEPGHSRRRCGRGFLYLTHDGAVIHDKAIKERLAGLAVPPAWRKVWYCRDAVGHIQAIGIDARGRKQYIYHPAWRLLRDRTKFDQLADFGAVLGDLRQRVDRDLRRNDAKESAVLAAAVRLLDATGIRVGNQEYFQTNGTVGLTTLQDRHVSINGNRVKLRFSAKGGKRAALAIDDRRLARMLLKCEELPGQRLLRYRRGEDIREIDSARLNDYLREITGVSVTAKDFRTWIATVTVVDAWLAAATPLPIGTAAKQAAAALNNTPAVTRRSYIHPEILRIAAERAPTASERTIGSQARSGLSGPERLCRRLLRAIRHHNREQEKGYGRNRAFEAGSRSCA
jgi:DNA topoisomerase-1